MLYVFLASLVLAQDMRKVNMMQRRVENAVDAVKDVGTKMKKKMRDLVATAQDQTRASIDTVDERVREVERGVRKDTQTLKKSEQKLTSKALKLSGKALRLVGDIARSESDTVKEAENLESEMAEGTVEFEDTVEKDTANAINKASKMGEQIGVDYEDFRTDAEDRLEELAGEKQEDIDQLASDIKEAASEEKAKKKNLDGVVKFLRKLGKDVEKQQTSTKKMVEKAVDKVMAEANAFPNQLEQQSADALTTVGDVSRKAEATLQKDMDSMQKDTRKGVNDLKKVANGKAKEIGKSIEQVQKDATGEMTALSKQVMKDLRDDTKSLDEMESNTQLHASDIEEWKRKVESALSKTEEHLGDVDRKLRDEMTDATDRFDVRKGNVQKSVRTQVATMKRQVLNSLDASSQKAITDARDKASATEASIKKGVDETMAAIDTVNGETSRIGVDVSEYRRRLETLMTSLDSIEESTKKEGDTVKETISSAQTKTLADIKDYEDQYAQLFEKKKVKMEDLAKKLQDDNTASLDVMKKHLDTKAGEMITQSGKLLAKTKAYTEKNQKATSQMIDGLQTGVSDVEDMTTNLQPEVKELEKRIQEVRDRIKGDSDAAIDNLHGNMSKLWSDFESDGATVQHQIEGEISTAEAGLDNDSSANDMKLKKKLASYAETLKDLEVRWQEQFVNQQAERDTVLSDAEKVRREGEQQEKDVSDMEAKLGTSIQDMKALLDKTKRDETRKTFEETRGLSKEIEDDFKALIERMISEAGGENAELAAKLESIKEKWNGMAAKDSGDLADFISKVEAETAKMSNQVSELNAELKGDAAQAEAYQKKNENSMNQIKNGVDNEVESIRETIAGEKKHLQDMMTDDQDYINNMDEKFKKDNDKNYKDASETTKEASNEAKKEAAEKLEEMEAEGSHFEDDVKYNMAEIKHSQDECNKGAHNFVDAEHKAEDAVNAAVYEYNNDKEIAEAKLGVEGREFEKKSAEDTGREVEDMDGTVNALRNAKAKIDGDITNFEDGETRKIDRYKREADSATSAIGKEADEVLKGEGDLTSEFDSETAPYRQELSAMQQRMQNLSDDFSHTIGTYDQRLAAIRKTRETKAAAIQQGTQEFQTDMLNVMEGTATQIENSSDFARNAFSKMEQERAAYDLKLDNISGFEANHESGLIDELETKAAQLERSNKQLTTSFQREKHQTYAWRNEAKRQLRNLERSMSLDKSQMESSELDYEMGISEKRRDMDKYVQGMLRDASTEEAGEVRTISDEAQSQLRGLASSEEATQEQEEAEMNGIRSNVQSTESGLQNDVDQAATQARTLEAKADEYHNRVNAAEAKLSDQFSAGTTDAAAYETQVQNLQEKLSTLGRSSLLQTAFSSALQEGASEPQVAALRSLNAELKKENDALRHEDEKLESRAKKISDALVARGISV